MMRFASVILCLVGLLCFAQAQVPMTGAGKGVPAGGGGGGGVTLVQQADSLPAAGATNVLTFGSPTTAGSVIACALNWQNSASFVSLTDSASDTSTDSGTGSTSDLNSGLVSIKAILAATAGVTTVTATFSVSTASRMHCYEIGGLSAKVFDKVPAVLTGQSTVPVSTNASTTLTSANEFALAYCSQYSNNFTAVGGGFTSDGASTIATPNIRTIALHDIVSATTSLTATCTTAATVVGLGALATLR